MKRFFALLLILASVSLVGTADAKVRGGAQKSDKITLMGVNVGCMACGNNSPGTPNVDWIAPNLEDMTYYRSKNLTLFRMPFKWERIQDSLGGPLITAYLNAIKQAAVDAESVGACIILDMHNYGSYKGNKISSSGGPTYAQYGDTWKAIANEMKDYKGICGYDLMNENNDMPNNTVTPSMFQAAITKIREVDMNTPIYIEGDAYASSYAWLAECDVCGGAPNGGWAAGGNDHLKNLVDPADKLIFSAHAYGDANGSGVYPKKPEDLFGGPECNNTTTWQCATALGDQLSGDPLDTNIMVKRFTPFVNWCKREGLKCHIGENGVPNDHPNWLEALDKGIEYLQANDIEYTYWNADGGTTTYPLNVDKRANGQDAVQMAVLTKYSNGIPPRNYVVSGPLYGDEDSPSTNFTVQYNGLIEDGPVTFTPNDNGAAGGTFTPSSVTVQPGFNATVNFTYTAQDAATYKISVTNDKGWTVPDPIGYATSTDVFRENNVTPYKVVSMQRVYAPYIGPCVTLRRASDNAIATFGWESLALNAKCDQTAAMTWAGGSDLFVVTLYDQTAQAGHWGIPVADGTAVPTPITNADQPQFVANYQNGLPAMLWNNDRMQTVSPINTLTGHTIMNVYRPNSQLSQTQLINYGWDIAGTDRIFAFGADIYDNSAASISRMKAYTTDSAWAAVAGSFSTASGGSFANGGTLVGKVNSGGHTINSPYRSYATIGFSPFSANRFAGYTGEMFTFQSKISDAAMLDIQQDQLSRWNIAALPAYTMFSPTLDQNTGSTENDAPWMGVGGTFIHPGFGATSDDTYPYWASRGANIYRMVMKWEQIQKGLCTGDTTLDPTVLAQMDAAVTAATSAGLDVLFDLHNYGYYDYSVNGCGSPPDDGEISNPTTQGYFADYWKKIAQHYSGNYKVKFDIMNEPTAVTDAEMMTAAQAVINAVRGVGENHWIFVEFSTGHSACTNVAGQGGPAFLTLSDPEDRIVLNCHQYITPCGYDACGPTSNNGQGKSSLTSATAYAQANNIKLFWGEAGIAAYGPRQYAETKNALDYIAANLDSGTGGWVGWNVWGAGTWAENYTFKQDPNSYSTPYVDRPTVRLLNTYFTGNSWKCADGSFGTAGVCPGTWPNAQYP